MDTFHAGPGEPDALGLEGGKLAGQQPGAARDGAAMPAAADQGLPGSIRLARFRALILPHLDAAYNLARYLTREPVAADDIVQEAFLRAYSRFDTYAGGDPRAWILQITRNCFLTWVKSRQAQRLQPLDGEQGAEAGTVYNLAGLPAGIEQETPESQLMRRADIEMVRTLIEELPQPFREVLVLREFEDLSYQQIASLTAIPIGTVMSRLARARQLFAKAWLDYTGREGR
jgi:RNA polymerase sigma-70 factor (ECF subfamily)